MVQRINLLLNKKQAYLLVYLISASLFWGCTNNIIDSNVKVPERKWTYRNHIVNSFEIKDNSKNYNIYFKLRHTADYKYSNIYILAHFKDGKNTATKRYQYKLAKNDGEWLGSGSGNIFSYVLPMQTNYRFAKNGRFVIAVEQNMRDNPLVEVVDLGILVEEVK
jgi:gliding motility-associated lipoprotein GldH